MPNDHAQIIERPRLSARFANGLDRRLTVVEAPMGYGKTTLMRSWAQSLEADAHLVGWISFETTRRHAARHLTDTLAGLGYQYDGETGLTVAAPGPEGARRFLILDDLHEADADCLDVVQDILRQAEHGLHVILGTREAPAIPLTRLRMANQVNDFDTEDLRFDVTEAQALFRNELPEADVAGYVDQAEGWVAALQLLRQFGLRHPARRPDFDQLAQFGDYLNEQYWAQLGEDAQQLLLHTSHLEKVDGDLANWMTGRTDGWPSLDALAAANGLIFAERQGGTSQFRYHSLLLDFLRGKQQRLGADRLSALHQKASEWYQHKGWLFEAMFHAFKAGQADHAAALLLEAGGVQYGMLNGAGQLSSCLELLDPAQVHSAPRLMLIRAYILLKTGRLHEATDLLQALRTEPIHDALLEREIILVEVHARIYSDANLLQRQLEALEYAMTSTPATDPLFRGMFANFLCMFLIEAGQFDRARAYGDQAMALYTDIGADHLRFFMLLHLSAIELDTGALPPALTAREDAQTLCHTKVAPDPSLRAIAEIYLGEAEFECGRVQGLASRLSRALRRIDRMEGWNMLYLSGYETCLALLSEAGDFTAAAELCEHAGTLVRRRGMELFSNQLTAMQLDLAVRAGVTGEARRLAGQVNAALDVSSAEGGLRWRGKVRAELAMARFEELQGAEQAAVLRMERCLRYCRAEGLVRLELRTLIRKFCLEARRTDVDACRATLAQYFALARQHQSVGAILREKAAFREAALWLVHAEGLGRFDAPDIEALARALWAASDHAGDDASILRHILSDKELGVLTELVKGHANKVIARTLQVTEPTVKFHLQNIYRKLGVNARKLAIEIARDHLTLAP